PGRDPFVANAAIRQKMARAASVPTPTITNGAVRATRSSRLLRIRIATSPPTAATATGTDAIEAHGTTGSTTDPQNRSPSAPDGVSYTSPPQAAIPPTNQKNAEAGMLASVTPSQTARALLQSAISRCSSTRRGSDHIPEKGSDRNV